MSKTTSKQDLTSPPLEPGKTDLTNSEQPSKENYKLVAKELGVHYLFGRWGIQFIPRDPAGHIYELFSLVKLDGWILDPKEVERIMRERGLEI